MKKVIKKKATSNATATATVSTKPGKKAKVTTAEPKGTKNLKEDLKDKNAKAAKQEVISMREVKYKYPEDIAKDALAKKAWRQKTRNKIEQFESKLFKATDEKEIKALTKEFNAYKEEVYSNPA